MKQVVTQDPCEINARIRLDASQAHHLFDVLRTTRKETVRVVSGDTVYLGRVDEKPFLYLFGKEEVEPRLTDTTLCVALIKSDRFEWMLQKAAELGVSRIVPFVSKHSVIQLDDKRALRKIERWNQILTSACAQCNRPDPVELMPITTLEGLAEYKSRCNMAAYEKEHARYISECLKEDPSSVTCCIGPEGGFTTQEAALLEDMGFAPVSLGNQILRTETACMFVLSCIDYQSHLAKEAC